jgi:hypothetical protein
VRIGTASLITSIVASLCSLTAAAGPDPAEDMARIIGRGDIGRDQPPNAEKIWLPLYQGNGRFGCTFGPWGLHLAPGSTPAYLFRGKTQFTHLKHHVRAKYGADYLLPVATIYWEQEPRGITQYQQHESFYDGTITTRFAAEGWGATVTTWFDPVHRDVAGFRVEAEGNCPPIIVAPFRSLSVHYGQHMDVAVDGQIEGKAWRAMLRCLDAKTPMTVRTNARMEVTDAGPKITLRPGRNDILVTVAGDADVTADNSLRETIQWWHSTWDKSGWLDLPDDTAQKVWVRSLAYVLYSHNDDGIGCSPPDGLAGNAWPFPFPFDSGCRQPLLLWAGQLDAARKWVEYWHSRIDGLRAYTRRIWKVDGVMLPHTFPYGPVEGYHDPEVPNQNYYPIYNAGHLVRIADQTAVMLNNPQWTKTYALPLIEGAAQFYLNNAKKGSDGLWHFHVIPSIGLDESGEINQKDYVIVLVSAQYAFQKAIEYGLDRDGRMQTILHDGLAFRTLLSEQGLYYNNQGRRGREFGHQKHPDQLSPLVHIPLGPQPDEPTRLAQKLRYDITEGARKPEFAGHTGGEFILADARMHDAQGWREDWSNFASAQYADPDWIQFYESSGRGLSFYVTTHGLVGQAILETVVSTWWGRLDLAPCIPWPGKVRFGNIRTLLGVAVSGEVDNGQGQATLQAWKDTSLEYQGQTITLRKGEKKVVPISR